jgi:signal transduction histidine kinase
MPSTPRQRIDWSQLWYPGPARAFTPDEMARAGADAPSPTLLVVLSLYMLSLVAALLMLAPPEQTLLLLSAFALVMAAGSGLAWWLWWQPTRRALLIASFVALGLMIAAALLVRETVPRPERLGPAIVLAGGCALLTVLLYFLVVWRAQQIESRLQAQAEREQAVEMARRLAAAQLEPHFLFNTLASLQHWVDTRDERASPLLAALTAYLRSTLPMFKQPSVALADEVRAVDNYLRVMQARLGTRLDFAIDIAPEVAAQTLPAGVLLTLVENAVQHGIEPQLAGGRVQVRARRAAAGVDIEVEDNGAGFAAPPSEGTGLANLRQRLALVVGPAAGFTLDAAPTGGTLARISLPHSTP